MEGKPVHKGGGLGAARGGRIKGPGGKIRRHLGAKKWRQIDPYFEPVPKSAGGIFLFSACTIMFILKEKDIKLSPSL